MSDMSSSKSFFRGFNLHYGEWAFTSKREQLALLETIFMAPTRPIKKALDFFNIWERSMLKNTWLNGSSQKIFFNLFRWQLVRLLLQSLRRWAGLRVSSAA